MQGASEFLGSWSLIWIWFGNHNRPSVSWHAAALTMSRAVDDGALLVSRSVVRRDGESGNRHVALMANVINLERDPRRADMARSRERRPLRETNAPSLVFGNRARILPAPRLR